MLRERKRKMHKIISKNVKKPPKVVLNLECLLIFNSVFRPNISMDFSRIVIFLDNLAKYFFNGIEKIRSYEINFNKVNIYLIIYKKQKFLSEMKVDLFK